MKQEREDPTEIEGRQALFIVNLKPRKMMGEVSEGMLFDVGYEDGLQPALLTPERFSSFAERANIRRTVSPVPCWKTWMATI